MHKLTDEELMELVKAGEIKAFETLFFRHKNKVFGYILNKSGDQETSEDILQEVFERVHRKAYLFNKDLKFLPWVFTITRNLLMDHYRKRSRQLKLSDEQDLMSPNTHTPSEIDLDHLPERYREALNLRYFEDQEFEAISKRMNITVDNARKTVSRALSLLRKEKLGEKK